MDRRGINNILNTINQRKNSNLKSFAVLIDPDKHTEESLNHLLQNINKSRPNFIFVGGSLVSTDMDSFISKIKDQTNIPIIIFPGSCMQISNKANAILLLSLISGRNPELLIGEHVKSALKLHNSQLEVIPTGYILLEGGKCSSVEYMSNTRPIPQDKLDIILSTALAAQQLGMQLIYLEAGSGASDSISPTIISSLKKYIHIPIIVGGGIRTSGQVNALHEAGASLIVSGTFLEEKPGSLHKLLD